MALLAATRRLAGPAAAIALFVTAAPLGAAPAAIDPDIVKIEFGIFEDDGSDQLGFGATAEIPVMAGQPYGWLVQVKTARKSLAVREEVLLPQDEAPAAESSDGDVTLPANRELLHSLNERRVPVADGVVFGMRKIQPNDMPGRYRMKVYIERKLAASFDYLLVVPAPAAAPTSPAPESGASLPRGKAPAGPAKKARRKPVTAP